MSEEAKKTDSTALKKSAAGIEGLLANPELLQTLGTLIGNMSGSKSTAPESAKEATAAPSSPSPAAVGTDGLSALLSNPEMMEKLPSIIATLKPMLGGLQPSNVTEAGKGELPLARDDRAGCRDQLLLSLKPFLSPGRCDAIDTMLRIAKLSRVLGQLK